MSKNSIMAYIYIALYIFLSFLVTLDIITISNDAEYLGILIFIGFLYLIIKD